MATRTNNIADMFAAGLKEGAKQRKSAEILDFMRTHWELFCTSKTQMNTICEELAQRNELTPTDLANSCGMPPNLLFKQAKVVSAAELVLDPLASPLYKQFKQQRDKMSDERNEAVLCIIVVAGARSVIITNMTPRIVPGLVHITIPETGHNDVHIIPVKDALARMPYMFRHED